MAPVVNIETREWRCKYNAENGIPSEHPRASTTDDVEGFFSVLMDTIGKDFTLKEVKQFDCEYCTCILYVYMYTGFLRVEESDIWVSQKDGS